MTRTVRLLQLAKSSGKVKSGELSSFVPSRLLSNSQASTSAASGNPEPAARSRERRGSRQADASNRRSESGRQRDDRAEPRGASRTSFYDSQGSPGSFASGPSSFGGAAGVSEQTGTARTPAEPEVGFVDNGAYPYAASEVNLMNVAGSTETGWEFLGSVDDQAITWFGMDFTRGTLPEVERNALLSNEAKEMMYQMHKHDSKRYSHIALASMFQIRQQRVMAILALKGMEHGDIAINPGKANSSSQAAPTPTPAAEEPSSIKAPDQSSDQTESESPDDGSAAQDAAADPDAPLDSRAQIVKEAMDAAAKEVPAYLRKISRQSASWQIASQDGTTLEQATDNNILMAWLKALVKDPFWIRPDKEDKGLEPVPDISSELEDAQDARTLAKADQEIEQQFLQDFHQDRQRNRAPSDNEGDANDPKEEGVERYLLSDPDYLPYIMEHELWDCHEPHGTGERHVKFLPRYPKFEFYKDDRPEALAADDEAEGGQANIERPVVSFWEEANRMQAEEEEVHLVRHFKERLNYNLQQTGASINRQSRSRAVTSRPKAGWSMVVQDVSKEGSKKQFVALPGGRTRRLTADEEVYLERMQPKRRKKIV